jgi:hypothetical protein
MLAHRLIFQPLKKEASMIAPRFKGEPDKAKVVAKTAKTSVAATECKCSRCTRSGESSDSSMAYSG